MKNIRCTTDALNMVGKDYTYQSYETVLNENNEECYIMINDTSQTKLSTSNFEIVEEIYLNKFELETIVAMLEQEIMCTGYTNKELKQLEKLQSMLERRSF